MNPQFARAGQVVLAVMALSQVIDSLTSLPSLVNDGMGHPRFSGMFALTRAAFGLLVVVHIWRAVAEGGGIAKDPFFLSVTVLAAGLGLWALRVLAVLRRDGR